MDPWAQLKMAVRTVISLTECASPPAIRVRNLQATCPPDLSSVAPTRSRVQARVRQRHHCRDDEGTNDDAQ